MSWRETNDRFINPYNFVPLEDACERKDIEAYTKDKQRVSGYMNCTLETLTPLIIPNTSCNKALHKEGDDQEGNSYDFYSYSNLEGAEKGSRQGKYSEPVIPGSEMRGVIRSVFEAAFNGCMSSVDIKRPLYRRTMTDKKAGILQWNHQDMKWEIVKCERVMLNTSFRGDESEKKHGKYVPNSLYREWKEGQVVSVLKSQTTYKTKTGYYFAVDYKQGKKSDDGWEVGYLHKGEPFGEKKHHESVFVPVCPKETIPVDDQEVNNFWEVIRQYSDEKINVHLRDRKHTRDKKHSGYKEIMDQIRGDKKNTKFFVYYSTYMLGSTLQATYLTPAIISKELFRTTIGDLLRNQGEYQPCMERDLVCPACALFGMVGSTSMASRIRFADAEVVKRETDSKEYYYKDLILELGEPKPGAVEFYTSPPEQAKRGKGYHSWTYDYVKLEKELKPLQNKELKLRGRKFHWHSAEPKKLANTNVTKMGQRLRAVKEGVQFTFRVYFDRITKDELAELHWALTFGDPACAHKLGRGKPLGYGSGRISVTEVCVRKFNQQTGEQIREPYDARDLPDSTVSGNAVKRLKEIASWKCKPESIFKSESKPISYPLVEGKKSGNVNDEASHQWFSANRRSNSFMKVLPLIEEEINPDSKHKWLYKMKNEKSNPKRQG